MINVQGKANSVKHLEIGMRQGRDKSLRYKAACSIHVGAGLVSARFRKSPELVRVPTRGTPTWLLGIQE